MEKSTAPTTKTTKHHHSKKKKRQEVLKRRRSTKIFPLPLPVTAGKSGGVSGGGHGAFDDGAVPSSVAEEIGSPYTPASPTPVMGTQPTQVKPPPHHSGKYRYRQSLITALEPDAESYKVTDAQATYSRANTQSRAEAGPLSTAFSMPMSEPTTLPPGACSSESARDERQRSFTAIVILAAMAAACVALSLLALWSRLTEPANKPHRTICVSQACVALNDMLLATANASVDPCENFYGYVCGGLAEPASVYEPASIYERHLSLFVDQVVTTLVQASSNRVRGPTKQAAVLLQSCLAIVEDDRDELGAFRNKLAQMGVVWPLPENQTYSIAVVAAKVFEAFRISPLLTVRKSRNKAGEEMLNIEPGDILPRWLKMRALLVKAGAYSRYFQHAAQLYTNASTTPIDFALFSHFEGMIIAELMTAVRDSTDIIELDSMEKLSPYVNAPVFEQLQIFLEQDLKLPSTTKVRIRAVKYLRQLLNASEQLGEWALQMYLNWCVLQAMWRFMSKPMSDLWYQIINATSDTVVQHPSHADCLELTESLLGWAVFDEFVRTHAHPLVRDGMYAITKTVAEAFVSQLTHGRWSFIVEGISFDASDFAGSLYEAKRRTGEGLIDIFDKVALNVSLLQNWLNISNTTAYIPDEELNEVSSSYIRQLRESNGYEFFNSRISAIQIPPLFPMLPLYHRESTVAANYGAIGTVLGAAAVQLFMNRLPTNSTAFSKAEEKLGCFTSPASSGSLPQSRQHTYLAAVVDLVWEAFMSADAWAAGGNHLLNYTSEATFFVVMCHLLCSVRVSLLAQLSCNEAVKNSRKFGEVFNCNVGTPMNPRTKCQFFSYS